MSKLELAGISNITLLFVDDEIGVIEAKVPRLQKSGFNVISTDNGKSAIEIVRNQKIDVLLIDFFMPDFNGQQAIEEIRKFNKEIVIILQTAYSGEKPPINMLQELD